MMKFLAIFSLFFVAINAASEFSILSSPKSVSFKGDDILESKYVGDVINACLGNPVTPEANWGGLIINDPFALAKGAVAIVVDGVDHVSLSSNAKTYELEGQHGADSINELVSQLESENVPVCNINFNELEESISSFQNCFGDIALPSVENTKNLDSSNKADKQLLQALSYVKAATNNLSNMLKSSNVLTLTIPLKNVIEGHGAKSDAASEALKLVSAAISSLNDAAQKSSQNNALVVVVAQSSSSLRQKRDTLAPSTETNDLNLAKYYSEDYPVIFNIILWFMVVFGLALLAISYAIGSMDPGRDSIIYRMTSTRMKKDN